MDDEIDDCTAYKDWLSATEDDEPMLSIGSKIKQIAGLAGTPTVDARTSEFIQSVDRQSDNGRRTSHLSERQVEWIEDIHTKHFGSAQDGSR